MIKFYEIKLKNGSCYAISSGQFKRISEDLSLDRSLRPDFITINNNNAIIRVDFIAEIYPEGRDKKEPWEIG
jgi:hypothetical protein